MNREVKHKTKVEPHKKKIELYGVQGYSIPVNQSTFKFVQLNLFREWLNPFLSLTSLLNNFSSIL